LRLQGKGRHWSDRAGRHHRITTNQSADFRDDPLRLAQLD
jgi:hypothetical protein